MSLKRAYLHLDVQKHTAQEWQRPGRVGKRHVYVTGMCRHVQTCDLKVEFVTVGVEQAQCAECLSANQSFPLVHSCNVYGFDRISFKCHLPPSQLPMTMSRNPVTYTDV